MNNAALKNDLSVEELARAARLRRMAAELTNEARAIESKYHQPKQKKGKSIKELFKNMER